MRLTRIAAAVFLLAFLTACNSIQPQITQKSSFYTDRDVNCSLIQAYVKPRQKPVGPLSALFFPFRVELQMRNPRLIGRETMRTFWQVWTAKEIFATQVYDDKLFYRNRRQALAEARSQGADLAVTGVITHYLHGGTRGDSSLSIRIDIFDTRSGSMIWSLAQAGRMEYAMDEDFILVERKSRMTEDPMGSVLREMANQMGDVIKTWSGGTRYGFAMTSADIVDGLLSPDGQTYPPEAVYREPQKSGFIPTEPNGTGSQRISEEQWKKQNTLARETPAGKTESISPSEQSVTVMEESPQGPVVKAVAPDQGPGVNLDIEFPIGSTSVPPPYEPLIKELADALKDPALASMDFVIRGHTDNIGKQTGNLKLSLERAEAVRDKLVNSYGIDPSRLRVQGFGMSRPIADNRTQEGRQTNRRVEIRAVPKS